MTDTAHVPHEYVTLDPAHYPAPRVSMANLAPAGTSAAGDINLGDPFLDAETVQSLHDAVEQGIFALDVAWQTPLEETRSEELERRFLERLSRTNLSPVAPTLHHRRMALYETLRDIGSVVGAPGFGFTVHNLTRAIGDIETWAEGKRQELASAGINDGEIARRLTMLTPGQLGALLQVSEVTLHKWRSAQRGPAWAKLSERAVRYPVATVLAWLGESLANAR